MQFNPEPVQKIAIKHLLANRCAALFMGTGLGKTASTLSAICELFKDGATKGVLIVAPLRVANLTWPAEIAKWVQFRWLKVANLRTREGWEMLENGTAHVYLCNFEMLPKIADKYFKGRRTVSFDAVVFDELTKAKNHKSKRINSIRQYLYKHCDIFWGLTGTPTPNGLLDLFAQIRLLDKGERLSPSFGKFRKTYFDQIDFYGYKWEPKPDARQRIYKRLKDIALTLRREDWLDIPDMFIEDVEVSMPSEVRTKYKELEKELLIILEDNVELEAVNAAVLVNKLLQMTSGAVYYRSDKNYHILHDAKLKALLNTVKNIGDRNCLIVYKYKHEVERILKLLPDARAFKDMKEKDAIEAWNAGKIRHLLVNPASMAHGLNMQQGGSDVVWYTLDWSSELYDQTNARVARRGQECETTIWRLLMNKSVDEAVAESLRSKNVEQSALLNALKVYYKQTL